jgi:hypothetical protein
MSPIPAALNFWESTAKRATGISLEIVKPTLGCRISIDYSVDVS